MMMRRTIELQGLTCLLLLLMAAPACDEKSRPAPEDTSEEEVVDVVEVDEVAGDEADAPDPVPDHPRIWITRAFRDTLELRQDRSTPNAVTIRDWCADHGEDDLDLFVDSRGFGVLGAVNYALLYQLQGSPTYATRAWQIVEHALDNPYEGYTADTWIEFDDFYTARNLVPAVALVLDWTWDWMNESRRERLVEQLDAWASRIVEAEPPGWEDPSSEAFHGYMWALMSAGYAMWDHHPDAATYIEYARDTMLEQGMRFASGEEVTWPVYDNTRGRAQGGMWSAGTSFGNASTEFLLMAVHAVRSAEEIVHPGFTFPEEVVHFNILANLPGSSLTLAEGDGADGELGVDTRIAVLLAVSLSSYQTQQHGQHWLNTHTSRTTTATAYRLFNEFIWYDDEIESEDYADVIADYHFARGTQTFTWRDGWGGTALWVWVRVGVLNTDHAHNGLGHLALWKGGWLVADKGMATTDSTLHADVDHNVLYVPPDDPTDEGRLFWGASTVDHFRVTLPYVYIAGDMTGPYTSQPTDRNNTVQSKLRQVLLFKIEKVLAVMDRASSFDAADDKIFQLHFESDPVASGTDWRVSSSSADLIVHTAWPDDATAAIDASGISRMRVTTPAATTDKAFLHLLAVRDTGGDLATFPVTATGPELATAGFTAEDGSADYVVTFTRSGDPPTSDITLSFDHASPLVRIYLMDMGPDTPYFTDHVLTGTTLDVTISVTPGSGTERPSNSDSMLVFEFMI